MSVFCTVACWSLASGYTRSASPGLQHSGTGTCFRNLLDGYTVNSRKLAPVVVIFLHGNVIAFYPVAFFADERASSAGMIHYVIAVFLNSCRTDEAQLSQFVQEYTICLRQSDYNGVIIPESRCWQYAESLFRQSWS